MTDPTMQAEVLNQALPYIQKFRGQTFVVKYGGSAMRVPELVRGVIRNVLLLQMVGIRVILVHGGGPEIDTWLERAGIPKKTVGGLRVTDDATMEIVEMALAGRANKSLVAEVQKAGGLAVGLSGRDADLIKATKVSDALGRVGEVIGVDGRILRLTTEAGYLPVVCSVATDADHKPLNVNADSAAAAIAVALGASKLILLTDTPGVLRDKLEFDSRISRLTPDEAAEMMRLGKADQGMIPKLQAAIHAIGNGVERVHLIDGAASNALLVEIFTDGGIGTMIEAPA